jgi:2',3'-cyclic-nucleotide 2'-phosphodiesterase/3'-nucleotidase
MLNKCFNQITIIVLAMLMVLGIFVFSMAEASTSVTVNIPLSTYFARVQVNPLYQLINMASVAFGEENIKGTEFEGLPVISRASVTKGGFKGADDFVNLPAGDITEDTKKFYQYNNTIQALKINGKQIIEWLEASAGNFNQIDPNSTDDQLLINYGFDSHHLDQFWGITYMYDVTQPLGERVVMAEYEGVTLSEDMDFIVMVDNYRAGGGGALPNAVPENIVMKWDNDYRNHVVDYLKSLDGIIPELVFNWSIKPIETKGRIIVRTGSEWGVPVSEYMEIAAEKNIEPVGNIEYVGTDDVWGLFAINLKDLRTP